jgi:hypothetical protein
VGVWRLGLNPRHGEHEEPTDHVLFTTDEGLNWREYKFTDEKVRVCSIVTVPSDMSCRFILFGTYGRSFSSVAVHVDFRRSRVHNVHVCPFSPVTPADAVVYR